MQWLEENAPGNAAALAAPASVGEIAAAQSAIGVTFPQELRTWLLVNNGVRAAESELDRAHAHDDGCFLSSGWHLLSTDLMVKVHERQMPSPNESADDSPWRRSWIPFAVEADWMYGYFVDEASGAVGSWGDYGEVKLAEFPSLSTFFDHLVEEMQTVRTVTDGRLDCD
ncbi:SMI1/KNR4 family protein [Streptomyces sp. P9(2023)]|nr:SMI1/KNR4 family protein [Streptomyces sp. P9(2023)]